MTTVEIKDITVKFKNGTKAADHVNLEIEKGIFGLLGENGAGKTTMMRVLSTLLIPREGEVYLGGLKYCSKNYSEIQKQIGYLPQELNLYPGLTVRETLEYLGGLSGVPKTECRERIDYLLEKTSLKAHQNKKTGSFPAE